MYVADLPVPALLHRESSRVLPLVVAQIPGVARADRLDDDVARLVAVARADPQQDLPARLVAQQQVQVRDRERRGSVEHLDHVALGDLDPGVGQRAAAGWLVGIGRTSCARSRAER